MAVSFEDAQKKIEQLFRDGWADLTPIAYDNVSYNPPNGLKEWVRVNVVSGDSALVGLNGEQGLTRNAGAIIIQIFTLQNAGTARAHQLADTVASIFRNVTVNGILYRNPSVTKVGVNAGGWYQTNVTISYQWDHSN